MGFAKWVYPVTLTPEQAKEKEMYEEQIKKYLYPRGTNEALADDFFNQLTAGREKWVDTEKMFCELSPPKARSHDVRSMLMFDEFSPPHFGYPSRSSAPGVGHPAC